MHVVCMKDVTREIVAGTGLPKSFKEVLYCRKMKLVLCKMATGAFLLYEMNSLKKEIICRVRGDQLHRKQVSSSCEGNSTQVSSSCEGNSTSDTWMYCRRIIHNIKISLIATLVYISDLNLFECIIFRREQTRSVCWRCTQKHWVASLIIYWNSWHFKWSSKML